MSKNEAFFETPIAVRSQSILNGLTSDEQSLLTVYQNGRDDKIFLNQLAAYADHAYGALRHHDRPITDTDGTGLHTMLETAKVVQGFRNGPVPKTRVSLDIQNSTLVWANGIFRLRMHWAGVQVADAGFLVTPDQSLMLKYICRDQLSADLTVQKSVLPRQRQKISYINGFFRIAEHSLHIMPESYALLLAVHALGPHIEGETVYLLPDELPSAFRSYTRPHRLRHFATSIVQLTQLGLIPQTGNDPYLRLPIQDLYHAAERLSANTDTPMGKILTRTLFTAKKFQTIHQPPTSASSLTE